MRQSGYAGNEILQAVKHAGPSPPKISAVLQKVATVAARVNEFFFCSTQRHGKRRHTAGEMPAADDKTVTVNRSKPLKTPFPGRPALV
jgi:hypothetical protein